eukprot:Selendium_serpulae@DN5512_c0_g1_i1.p2
MSTEEEKLPIYQNEGSDEGLIKGLPETLSAGSAVSSLVCGMLGTGLFTMPFLFALVGPFTGVMLISVSGFLSFLSAWLLAISTKVTLGSTYDLIAEYLVSEKWVRQAVIRQSVSLFAFSALTAYTNIGGMLLQQPLAQAGLEINSDRLLFIIAASRFSEFASLKSLS